MITLDGIYSKLQRAEHQIQELTHDFEKACSNVKKFIVREVHEDTDEQVWIYRGESPCLPLVFSVKSGEILYNLRSTLDHLVWQLVLANGQEPERNNEFPISSDHQSWERKKAMALKGVSKRNVAMIGYVQPYTGGINLPFDVSMLSVLEELGNTEKHRHLILTVMAFKGIEPFEFGVNHPELNEASARQPLHGSAITGKIEPGKELLRFNNAQIELKPSLKISVSIGNSGLPIVRALPLSEILKKCLDTVKGSVQFLTTPLGNGFLMSPKYPPA